MQKISADVILPFPRFRQTFDYDCGANALQSVLAYYGIDVRAETLIKKLKTSKTGTVPKNIERVARSYGLKAVLQTMDVRKVKGCIRKGTPVIILLQAWASKKKNYKNVWHDGHYVVAIGYDSKRLYFEDPSVIFRAYLTYKEFEDRWHDETSQGDRMVNIGIAVYGKRRIYDSSKAIHMD